MKTEFIPYEQALALKELGFNEPCFKGYTEEYKTLIAFSNTHTNTSVRNTLPTKPFTAPLYQQAFRWFREKYNLLGGVYSNASGWAWEIHDNVGGTHRFASEYTGDCLESGMFTSFEKAELACLEKLIEIVKTNADKISSASTASFKQERMYSEEEVKQIIDATLIEFSDYVLADVPHWFEQFKK
jgi:hypothetical protein